MAFTLTSPNLITQTLFDGNLSGILATGAVTATTESGVAVYTMDDGVSLRVEGILHINPETNKLVGNVANLIVVNDSLILGGATVAFVAGTQTARLFVGSAISNSNAPIDWKGAFDVFENGGTANNTNTTLYVESSGSLRVQGATLDLFGVFYAAPGSTIYIEDAIFNLEDLTTSDIDPKTGNFAVASEGIYSGANMPDVDRGFISIIETDDLSITDLLIARGGELVIKSIANTEIDSGTGNLNTRFGNLTPKRGISGISATSTSRPIYPFGNESITYKDTEVSGRNNTIDVALVTPDTVNTSTIHLVNTCGGTDIRCIATKAMATTNRAVVRVAKNVNVNVYDALTGNPISDTTIYVNDTDNSLRTALYQNSTGFTFISNDTDTIPSTDTIVYDDIEAKSYFATTNVNGVLDSDLDILLGTIKVPHGNTAQNTTNDPANTASENLPFRWDLRGETNVPGEDRFTFHVWHPEYNYMPVSASLAEGSDVLTIELALLSDPLFSNNVPAGLLTTTDQMYDVAKSIKGENLMRVEDGGPANTGVTSFGTTLDLQDRMLQSRTTNKVGLTFIRFNTDKSIQATDKFDTIKTLSSIDLNAFDVNTDITLIGGEPFTNPPRDNFPAGWTLSGALEYTSNTSLIFAAGTDVSQIDLSVIPGKTVDIYGKLSVNFKSVSAGIFIGSNITFAADHIGDITIYNTVTDTIQHFIGVDSATAQLTATEEHVAVVNSNGRLGRPVRFSPFVGEFSTKVLSSDDLSQIGYFSNIDIGPMLYDIVEYNSRQILTATVNEPDTPNYDFRSESFRGVKWFGDLCGAKNVAGDKNLMGEVMTRNSATTVNTDIFTLNPRTLVTTVNLPLVRAIYGNSPSQYQFLVDLEDVKTIDSNYLFTDEVANVTTIFSEITSLITTPSDINGVSGIINVQGDRVVSDVSRASQQQGPDIQSHIEFEFEQYIQLGVKS